MHLSRASLIGAFAALAVVSSARGDPIGAPTDDQAVAQQRKDESDCRRWASHHTGFDPKESAPSEPPRTVRPLDPPSGPGHAVLREARQRDEAKARKKQRAQDQADFESRRANYERALKQCLEGRGAAPAPGK
jgi:hypothetical protein